jgi:methyl-accepting chemotaxis protein
LPDQSSVDQTTVRLTALEAGQKAMNQALGLMIDTLQQQTNLLSEIAQAVRQEPGPSPIVQGLDELTAAVVQMGAGVETLHAKLDELPAAIGAVLDGGEPP